MLVAFLQSLNFCQTSWALSTREDQPPDHTCLSETGDGLEVPGVVQLERPEGLVQLVALEIGWWLRCVDPTSSILCSRGLQGIHLSVGLQVPYYASQGLNRMCRVWKNGIFWRNYDNITTVIELLDNNRCVLVAMSCDDSTPVEHAELRSSLIALVHHLQQQYCPRLNVCEFLISPDLIQKYPVDPEI